MTEQNLSDIDKSTYDAVLTSYRKPIYERLLELEKERKWRLVFKDNLSAVFVRNK